MAKMDGNWLLTGGALLFAAVCPQACQSLDNTVVEDNEVVLEYLDDIAVQVMQPEISITLEHLDVLIDSIQALENESISSTSLELSLAQDAFATTMLQWQRMEVFQIGPWSSSLLSDVGQDLRDDVYSWPLVNSCRIDQVTASKEYLAEDFFEASLVSVRGLDAIGYLLSVSVDSTCPSQVPPISDGVWAELSEDEIQHRRIEYAQVLAEGIKSTLLVGSEQWSNGFPHDLYENQSEALNDVFNAMLYVEEMVKERKIAHPLGLRPECSTDCYLDVEGGDSVAYLIANLQAFELLFTLGTDDGGMTGVLSDIGEGEIANQIVTNTQLTIEKLETLEDSLAASIQQSPEDVQSVLDVLSDVTSPLKWDLAAVLRLEVPKSTAGDND